MEKTIKKVWKLHSVKTKLLFIEIQTFNCDWKLSWTHEQVIKYIFYIVKNYCILSFLF